MFEFGGPLTIFGANFGSDVHNVQVMLGTNAVAVGVVSVNQTQIVCNVPAGKGQGLLLQVWIGPAGHQQLVQTSAFNYQGMICSSRCELLMV